MSIGKLWYERDCCYTCAHWDITAVRECTEVLEGLTLVIDGDATVKVYTDADFCCAHHCDIDIDEDEP